MSPISPRAAVSPKQNEDSIWRLLKDKLPWGSSPEHVAKRDQFWAGFDVNGNGYLSLAEVDKGIRDVLGLPALFAAKPVLMRAFMMVKEFHPAMNKHSDDYITKGEEF